MASELPSDPVPAWVVREGFLEEMIFIQAGAVGSTLSKQRRKMWEWEAYLNGSGSASMMKMVGERAMGSCKHFKQ